MKKINKYHIIITLLIISLLASLILSLTPTPPVCEAGCDIVQTSSYASLLGIKNSTYGVFIFLILIYLTFLEIQNHDAFRKKMLLWGFLIGSIISIYFLYLQAFVINAWCKYCLVVDFSMIIGLIVILLKWKE